MEHLEQINFLPQTWLRRIPELFNLVWVFYCLTLDYDFKWAHVWPERWEDWDWIKRAMKATFDRLKDNDKAVVQKEYESFLQNDKFCDWHEMAKPALRIVKCKVTSSSRPISIICELRADTEAEAIELIQSRGYEFEGFLSNDEFSRELKNRGGMMPVKNLAENNVTLCFG